MNDNIESLRIIVNQCQFSGTHIKLEVPFFT